MAKELTKTTISANRNGVVIATTTQGRGIAEGQSRLTNLSPPRRPLSIGRRNLNVSSVRVEP